MRTVARESCLSFVLPISGMRLDAGAEAHQRVRDVGGGKLVASVKDADGNVIGLLQSA